MSAQKKIDIVTTAAENVTEDSDIGKVGSMLRNIADSTKQILSSDKKASDLEETVISQEEEIEKLKTQVNRLLNRQRQMKKELKQQQMDFAKVSEQIAQNEIGGIGELSIDIDASTARNAIILSEIIGLPVSRRRGKKL